MWIALVQETPCSPCTSDDSPPGLPSKAVSFAKKGLQSTQVPPTCSLRKPKHTDQKIQIHIIIILVDQSPETSMEKVQTKSSTKQAWSVCCIEKAKIDTMHGAYFDAKNVEVFQGQPRAWLGDNHQVKNCSTLFGPWTFCSIDHYFPDEYGAKEHMYCQDTWDFRKLFINEFHRVILCVRPIWIVSHISVQAIISRWFCTTLATHIDTKPMGCMLPNFPVKLLVASKLRNDKAFTIIEQCWRIECTVQRLSHLQQNWSQSLRSCNPVRSNVEDQVSAEPNICRSVVYDVHKDTQYLEGVKHVLWDVRLVTVQTDPQIVCLNKVVVKNHVTWLVGQW